MPNDIPIWIAVMLLFIMILYHDHSTAHDGLYVELGIGKNGLNEDYWLGRNDIGCYFSGGYTWHINRITIDLAYRHASQCDRGTGYDDRDETVNNSLGLYGRYYIF